MKKTFAPVAIKRATSTFSENSYTGFKEDENAIYWIKNKSYILPLHERECGLFKLVLYRFEKMISYNLLGNFTNRSHNLRTTFSY